MPKIVSLDSRMLAGKVIDVHTHIGLTVSGYLSGSYPYCQSAESLLCRMDQHAVDYAVTFPYGEGTFFDIVQSLHKGKRVPANPKLSDAPYVAENRLLCQEIYEATPGAATRLLPFVCIDPGRRVRVQLREIEALAGNHPIYGIKVAGVTTHSSHKHLMGKAAGFVDFARARNIPMLMHSTAYKQDKYCYNEINLAVAKKFGDVRFCLAHCLGFDRPHLDQAHAMDNVWVDSAAMKIQVEADEVLAPPERRYPSNYADHKAVFRDLVHSYPRTLVWGSDSPAYSYVTKRRYPDGTVVNFDLQGTYGMERDALDALPPPGKRRVSDTNTRRFLFGQS